MSLSTLPISPSGILSSPPHRRGQCLGLRLVRQPRRHRVLLPGALGRFAARHRGGILARPRISLPYPNLLRVVVRMCVFVRSFVSVVVPLILGHVGRGFLFLPTAVLLAYFAQVSVLIVNDGGFGGACLSF